MAQQKYDSEFADSIMQKIKNSEITVKQASEQYNVPIDTLYAWRGRFDKNGKIDHKRGRKQKFFLKDFEKIVEENKTKNTQEIAVIAGCSVGYAGVLLNQLGYKKIWHK